MPMPAADDQMFEVPGSRLRELREAEWNARVVLPEAQERFQRAEAENYRLRKLVEPKEWQGWEQVDSIYDEARLLRRERDDALSEVSVLRAVLAEAGVTEAQVSAAIDRRKDA
jgi:hypothetical protein